MNRKVIFIVSIIALLFDFSIASAQNISDDQVTWIYKNFKTIFPATMTDEVFLNPEKKQFEVLSSKAAADHQIQFGKLDASMYANPDTEDRTWLREAVSGTITNFYVSMDVYVNDNYPADKAFCGVRFSDKELTAANDYKTTTVQIGDGINVSVFDSSTGEATATDSQALWNPKGTAIKIEVIHLFGHTLYFANSQYVGQIEDDIMGRSFLYYGLFLNSGGTDTYCSFDNIVVRRENY